MINRALYSREEEIADSHIEEFERAILKAYPTKEFLYRRLANKWGIRVEDDVTATDQPGAIIISRIVEFARSEGRLLDLLGLAWSDKPQNPALKRLSNQWLDDRDGVLARYSTETPTFNRQADFSQQALEKIIEQHSRLIRLPLFIEGLNRMSDALCRICVPGSKGSGFLIGRQTVLTNYHVVESALAPLADGNDVICEFNLQSEVSALRVPGKPGNRWIGPNSRYSSSDLTGTGEPGTDELDFAIIHLDEPVEAERCPLELPRSAPIVSQNDYLMIGQHPGGEEAQIALGRVVELPRSGLRYRYDVTTKAGSSGSPVLDLDLNLVGLHHAADPASDSSYNQGIPIHRIVSHLAARGFETGGR